MEKKEKNKNLYTLGCEKIDIQKKLSKKKLGKLIKDLKMQYKECK